jgi:hypothetical protein
MSRCRDKRLELAQLLGQLGVFLTFRGGFGFFVALPGGEPTEGSAREGEL